MSGRYKVKVAIENKLLTVADLERKLKEEYRKTMLDIDKNIGLNKKYTEELKKNKSDFKIKIKKDYSASIKEKISTFLDKVEKFNNSVVFSDLKQEMCEQTKLKTKYLKLANKFKLNSGLNIKTETKNLKEYIQILKNLKKNVKEKVNINKQKILKYRENYKILVLEKNKVELTIENYVNFEDKISELTNIFESIDKEMACILINDEYEKMSRELKKLKELKQNSIVKKYDDIKNRLIILKDEFEEKKQEVLALKNEIESNLFEINLIKSNQEINDIYSYIEGKDEKIEIFSFAKKYGVKLTNSEEQYSENLIEIQKFLVSYNYDKAFALASQTLKELNQDINLIHSEYERLINEVNYAKNVIKTGAELGIL